MTSPAVGPVPVRLPRFGDERGFLSFVEGGRHLPFAIGGVRWWRPAAGPLPGHEDTRDGGLIALRGTVQVALAGGGEAATVVLDAPDRALVVPSRAQATVTQASDDAVVVAFDARPRASDVPPPPGADASRLSTVDDCRIVPLPRVGRITAAGGATGVAPFPVERLYWLFGVPGAQSRGSHAHKELQQLIVAAAGSFRITLDDGQRTRTILLNRPDVALYVPRLIWRDLGSFSPDAVCLVLASMPFAEDDYLRAYPDYVQFRAQQAAG